MERENGANIHKLLEAQKKRYYNEIVPKIVNIAEELNKLDIKQKDFFEYIPKNKSKKNQIAFDTCKAYINGKRSFDYSTQKYILELLVYYVKNSDYSTEIKNTEITDANKYCQELLYKFELYFSPNEKKIYNNQEFCVDNPDCIDEDYNFKNIYKDYDKYVSKFIEKDFQKSQDLEYEHIEEEKKPAQRVMKSVYEILDIDDFRFLEIIIHLPENDKEYIFDVLLKMEICVNDIFLNYNEYDNSLYKSGLFSQLSILYRDEIIRSDIIDIFKKHINKKILAVMQEIEWDILAVFNLLSSSKTKKINILEYLIKIIQNSKNVENQLELTKCLENWIIEIKTEFSNSNFTNLL